MEKTTNNKRLIIILIIASAILLIPIIAMQFSNQVNWNVFDFIIAGILFISTGLIIEYILRKVKSKKNRAILIVVILILLLIIFTEIAVGIFGSPIAGS